MLRNRRTISTAFDLWFLSSGVPYSLGALAPDKTRGVLSPQESFVPATLNRCGWVLEHLGIAQAPAWLFAAELREGTFIRLLTAFERTVPILAVRPASRRLSTKVHIFIEQLEKTFAVCS